MKKTLLTFLFAVATVVAMAQTTTYTDNLIVTIDGESSDPQETTIFVEQNANGTYKLALNNFVLGGEIQVGNIVLDNITTTESNGIKSFQTSQDIFITAGEGNEEDWLGPQLGAIPVSLTGKMDAEKLYCTIDIDMSDLLGQIIYVVFGEDFAADSNNSVVEYTDNLVVTIDGESTDPQETTIIVEQNANGTYKLALNNFVLGGEIQVGNIVLDNITTTESNGIKSFQTSQDIFITAGEGNEENWLGPQLGAIPVSLTGKMDAEKLYCTIDIDMSDLLGQIINVVFGEEKAVTNIENITVENGAKVIYDLTGRKVDAITTAGIYIVNGKKVLVK
ncbi:MAG: calycin-like domain-containing protein [Bacteroidaceae bacterium]|nr:calycin-like domain-containing protein [Bacteroidaceae bacterium]